MAGGKDKVESMSPYLLTTMCADDADEELLRYGLPTDVWFHVECVSTKALGMLTRKQAIFGSRLPEAKRGTTSWGMGQAPGRIGQ